MKVIGFPKPPDIIGGPGGFQTRISNYLSRKGWKIVYPKDKIKPDIILVIGGTKHLFWLIRNKLLGTKILQRLDGLNWRYKIQNENFLTKLTAIINNQNMVFIRNFLACIVIYQSIFVKKWWYTKYGKSRRQDFIITNGVDLEIFKPRTKKNKVFNLYSLEGTIQEDNFTYNVIKEINRIIDRRTDLDKYILFGKISNRFYDRLKNFKNIIIKGSIERTSIPDEINKLDIMINLEINPPCPNSVIESLASGKPVIGYDMGSLKDLVNDSGYIINYKGNSWKMELPDLKQLENAIDIIIKDYNNYSKKARSNAIKNFDLNIIVEKYISTFKK